jgi:hypothetical protein
MILSDIYKACEEGDINLVRTIIETSSLTTDINCLEPNGSTALHIACEKGYADIVQLLLHEYDVRRHQTNKVGRTAYEISTNEIRELFRRSNNEKNPFCTNEDFQNPFEIINKENPNWLKFYSNSSPILRAALNNYTNGGFEVPWNGYIHNIKRFFGFDPDKEKIEQWSKHLQRFVDEHLSTDPNTYSKASECLEDYRKTRKIEYLLRLYTLQQNICQYFVQDKNASDYFYEAIYFNLPSIRERANEKPCYRGLTMTENDFKVYRRALENKGNYLGMNTFSSTSINLEVANMFFNQSSNLLQVLLIIDFPRLCPTAIALYKLESNLPCISKYEDEEEVLILPGTVFSVTKIEENSDTQLKIIHLEHYDASDEVAEIIVDRIEGYVDNMLD